MVVEVEDVKGQRGKTGTAAALDVLLLKGKRAEVEVEVEVEEEVERWKMGPAAALDGEEERDRGGRRGKWKRWKRRGGRGGVDGVRWGLGSKEILAENEEKTDEILLKTG